MTGLPDNLLPNLEALSVTELKALVDKVEPLIQRREEEKRQMALTEIARLAGDVGLSPEAVEQHLSHSPRKRKRRTGSLPAKYRDPEDPALTWAGRGKRPKWLEARLAAGARLEDFRLTKTGSHVGTRPHNLGSPTGSGHKADTSVAARGNG